MAEEKSAALQPPLRKTETTGDPRDGSAKPGQHFPDQHRDPTSPLCALFTTWHAKGKLFYQGIWLLYYDYTWCFWAQQHIQLELVLVSRLWTRWRVEEPFAWWRKWTATACLRPPSLPEPRHFAPSPAPAQVSTDCLAGVRGSRWRRWASGLQLRWSRWRFSEVI